MDLTIITNMGIGTLSLFGEWGRENQIDNFVWATDKSCYQKFN